MRVATFNVRHGRPERSRHPDTGQLVAAVRSLDADVIGLQELDRGTARVGGADQPALLAEATGMDLRFARAIDHDGGQYGVALASRIPLGATEVLRLPGGGEPRVAVLGVVTDRGSTGSDSNGSDSTGFDGAGSDGTGSDGTAEHRPDREGGGSGRVSWAVGCTHLTTVTSDAVRQLGIVLDALVELADGRPAVLLGDLNLGAEHVGPVISERGWIAAPSGPTHPTARPARRIDWVLVRSGSVTSSAVLDVRVSDHRPLIAVVRRSERREHRSRPVG